MRRVPKPIFFIVLALIIGLSYVALRGIHLEFGDYGEFPIEVKGANQIRLGIDIRGGVDAVFEPKDPSVDPTDGQLDAARIIFEKRLDSKNVSDREITVDKTSNRIFVRFPFKTGETEADGAKAMTELGATAKLTFRDVQATPVPDKPDANVIVEGANVTDARAETDQNSKWQVKLTFNEVGTAKFAEATQRLLNKQIGIYLDDLLYSAPTVNDPITDGIALITRPDGFSRREAEDLANTINAGRLPYDLISKDNSTISPTLGANALGMMLRAGLLAFILISLFMIMYYRLPGFIAFLALTLQVSGMLLFTSIPQFTLTLPGIAGIILSIGMGVDANIITNERIKEELKSGKTLSGSIDLGYDRAFSAIFDGNITVMIVAILLFWFGSGAMKSFGYTLFFGVVMNFLAGVTVSRLMLKSISNYDAFRNPVLYGSRGVSK